MNVEFDNNIPIYIQLLDYLKTYIVSGKIDPGDKLPSVREFSEIFKVNPNTMQKALNELEEMGLIYTERTNGKYVTNDMEKIKIVKDLYAKEIVESYFTDMEKLGINKKDAMDYLRRYE